MGVIYLRTNKINGKKYVGQVTTKRFKARQNKWNNLNLPYAGNVINNARKKYGIESFGFEILKECEDEELNQWEMYYIKELNTKVPNGYNMTDGGDGCPGYIHSEETKQKINKDTNEIITEFPSVSEVKRQLGISITHISQCCRGKLKSAYGFKWQYK